MANKKWAKQVAIATEHVRHVMNTVSAAGTSIIIAAPGLGRIIAVTDFVVQTENQNSTVLELRNGVAHPGYRILGQVIGDGLSKTFPPGREWRLGPNAPLTVWLSGAGQWNYSIAYFIEQP